MELAHNLTLNEEVVKTLPEDKRSVFIFEWLQFLDKVLSALNRVIITYLHYYLHIQTLSQTTFTHPDNMPKSGCASCVETLKKVLACFKNAEIINFDTSHHGKEIILSCL